MNHLQRSRKAHAKRKRARAVRRLNNKLKHHFLPAVVEWLNYRSPLAKYLRKGATVPDQHCVVPLRRPET